ncbi:MAG: hypothetical protein QOE06_2943 [Thermoleophilaceae bacterium]|nr:hypothetical protein [Thermoleophilaceae bacterium]
MFDTAAWKAKYRDACQEKLPDEQVEAAWLFYRTGGYAALALGPLSPLAATISRTIGKKRAGGLPNQFLLALTPDRVYAFKCRPARATAKVGKELAVWDRSGLHVTAEDAAINTTVTIESPAEGERIRCSTGKDATSREFLELLMQPSAASAVA